MKCCFWISRWRFSLDWKKQSWNVISNYFLRGFPDGLAQLTNQVGFSSVLLMSDSCVRSAPLWTPTFMCSHQLVAVLKTHRADWILPVFSHTGLPCSTNGNLSIFISGLAADRDYWETHLSDWILDIQNHYLNMPSMAQLCIPIYLPLLGEPELVHLLQPSLLLWKLTILTT